MRCVVWTWGVLETGRLERLQEYSRKPNADTLGRAWPYTQAKRNPCAFLVVGVFLLWVLFSGGRPGE